MATSTRLMTVEEYSLLPNPPGGRQELHHGEVFTMSEPPRYHADVQHNIYNWLLRHVETHYRIRLEFACRPLPEYEVWAVDVGITTKDRWKATKSHDWLAGAPEVSIEVLSPSNTKREMQDRRETLFRGGCQQFWTVDADTRTVAVTAPDGSTRIYSGTDSISLQPYSTDPLPLAEVFAEIE